MTLQAITWTAFGITDTVEAEKIIYKDGHDIAVLEVNNGISNTIVLEIPKFTTKTAIYNNQRSSPFCSSPQRN